jgi:hypothetical protein
MGRPQPKSRVQKVTKEQLGSRRGGHRRVNVVVDDVGVFRPPPHVTDLGQHDTDGVRRGRSTLAQAVRCPREAGGGFVLDTGTGEGQPAREGGGSPRRGRLPGGEGPHGIGDRLLATGSQLPPAVDEMCDEVG